MIDVATKLRKGMVIKWEGVPCLVTMAQHQRTGRGGANIQCKMRNLETDRQVEYRFGSDEKFEEIELDQIPMEFLYQDGNEYWFMNNTTFEQVAVTKEVLGDTALYLTPNVNVSIFFYDGNPLEVKMPNEVTLTITETGPNIKGNSSGAITKPATCETGLVVQVPMFVENGEKITVLTETGAYTGRAKD